MKFDIDRIGRLQHGVISRSQLESGLTKGQIETLIRNQSLIRVRQSVYRLRGAPESWNQSMMAAVLATGGVASHVAAGKLWSLPGCDQALVELTVSRTRSHRTPHVTVHHSETDIQLDSFRNGIPVSGIERTIIELSVRMNYAQVGIAMDYAIDHGLTSVKAIQETLLLMGSKGRAKTRTLKLLIDARSDIRVQTSVALHRKTIRRLLAAGIDDFETEYRIKVNGRRRYIDIAWPKTKLAIEVDGYWAHKSRSSFDDDRNRANEIVAEGWEILRVTSNTTTADLIRWTRKKLKDVA